MSSKYFPTIGISDFVSRNRKPQKYKWHRRGVIEIGSRAPDVESGTSRVRSVFSGTIFAGAVNKKQQNNSDKKLCYGIRRKKALGKRTAAAAALKGNFYHRVAPPAKPYPGGGEGWRSTADVAGGRSQFVGRARNAHTGSRHSAFRSAAESDEPGDIPRGRRTDGRAGAECRPARWYGKTHFAFHAGTRFIGASTTVATPPPPPPPRVFVDVRRGRPFSGGFLRAKEPEKPKVTSAAPRAPCPNKTKTSHLN